MDMVVIVMLIVMVCAAVAYTEREKPTLPRKRCRRKSPRVNEATAQERAKEAFYMQNFWSYDGSEQREFDE